MYKLIATMALVVLVLAFLGAAAGAFAVWPQDGRDLGALHPQPIRASTAALSGGLRRESRRPQLHRQPTVFPHDDAHARNRLIVGLAIEPRHYRSAAKLLKLHGVSHGLRTLDALQLAVALDMLEASSISVILSADKRLCEVAEACGCPAIDPAQPGLIQG